MVTVDVYIINRKGFEAMYDRKSILAMATGEDINEQLDKIANYKVLCQVTGDFDGYYQVWMNGNEWLSEAETRIYIRHGLDVGQMFNSAKPFE
jgi:hypothetical protein